MGSFDYGKWGFLISLIMLIMGSITFFVSIYKDFDPIYYYIAIGLIILSIGYFIGKYVHQSRDTGAYVGVAVPDSMKKRSRIEVCPGGPHYIDENFTEFPLNVLPNQHIKGYLEEMEGQKFDYWIIDFDGLLELKDNKTTEYQKWAFNKKYHKVRWPVPEVPKGPWYLVIDIDAYRNPRLIKIILHPVED